MENKTIRDCVEGGAGACLNEALIEDLRAEISFERTKKIQAYAENARLRAANDDHSHDREGMAMRIAELTDLLARSLYSMIEFGNALNWRDDIPQSYADTINEIRHALSKAEMLRMMEARG